MISRFLQSGAVMSISSDEVLIGCGEYKWLNDSDKGFPYFYFPDYFLANTAPWLQFEQIRVVSLDWLKEQLQEYSGQETAELQWDNPSKPLFEEAFQEIQTLFQIGNIQKAVPFVYEKAHGKLSSDGLGALLSNALLYTSQNPVYLYGFWNNQEGMLGCTPEFLFELQSNNLRTMACAGTCSQEEVEFFAKDPKQLHEHQIVIDGINESLSLYGKLLIEKTQVVEFPNLCHLITPISLVADKPLNINEMIEALHPTPALGAHPKERGMEWLINYEKKNPRNRFGAPAGYLLEDTFKAYVAIRNMQWTLNELKIFAGCGIVPDSQCGKEWDEIGLKIKSIKSILGL